LVNLTNYFCSVAAKCHLCKCHTSDDGQHDLLALGRVRVLDVLKQPGLECACWLPRGVLASNVQTRHCTVTARQHHHRRCKQESRANAQVSARQLWTQLTKSPLHLHSSQSHRQAQNAEKIWTCSSSRSSKVIDLGVNRKRIYMHLYSSLWWIKLYISEKLIAQKKKKKTMTIRTRKAAKHHQAMQQWNHI